MTVIVWFRPSLLHSYCALFYPTFICSPKLDGTGIKGEREICLSASWSQAVRDEAVLDAGAWDK